MSTDFIAFMECPHDIESENRELPGVTGWSLVPDGADDTVSFGGEFGYHIRIPKNDVADSDRVVVYFAESEVRKMLAEIEERKLQYPEYVTTTPESEIEAGPLTQSGVFSLMNDVETATNEVLHTVRAIRANAPTEVLQAYGGSDYPRQLSLGITQLESGMLWLGQVIEEPLS